MAGGLLKILFVCLCFQIVLCQFGYFPTREERRYPSTFGFSQNFFPNPSKITDTISKIIHLERENLFSNPAFIYPFQNRPITNPNQNPYSNNVRFPDREQTQFPNSDQPNNSGYPGNSANVPSNTGFGNNNPGFTNYPTFTNTNNPEGVLTSGQHNGPVFGAELSNIGNGGTESLQSGQQTGPAFGEGEPNGSSGNLTPGQVNGPVLPNFDNRVPDTLVTGQQTGPVSSQGLPNIDIGSTLVSGQNNGLAFNTEAPNLGNSGTDTLFSGQHTGPIFGPNIENGESTLASGQNNGPAFNTEAPNLENSGTGTLVSGQHTGPIFGPNIENGESTLVSGQNNGPAFNTEAPNLGNSGTGTLVSGQHTGPIFGSNIENGESTLVSGQNNGPAFNTEAPNLGNSGTGTLVSGQHTGPIFGPNIENSQSTLVSGEHTGNVFSTEAPIFGSGGPGSLVSGQQTGPSFEHNLPNSDNDGSTLVSGQNNGPIFGIEKPNFENIGISSLVSGQQSGPVFGQDLPNISNGGSGNLVSGQQNGPVFGIESPNNENKGILITGKHSGPVFSPDTPLPDFESRNDFNQGIFKETCTTVDGGIGTCISIITCAPYVTLLQQAKTNPAAVRQLRAAHCGFEGNNPKVCCPLPAPPTGPPTAPPIDTPSGKSIPPSDFITAFPEPPVCGYSNASFSRVVGGVNAKLGDFPWMTLLGYHGRQGGSTRWLCGGSLISQHHVLTAAHCINGHEEDLYVVRLGELDLARDDEGATPIDVLIKNKIKHEKYNATSFGNDIGILVLERDVDFTDLIRPICIPTRADLRANSFVDYNPLIAGWGDTEFRGPSASHLQVLQLPVLENSYCVKAYSRYTAQVIDDRVMCAGFKKGGKDACQGDSGGPLMQPVYNPVEFSTYFYQTGVVSFGRKCAEAGFPGIYTRVTYFVPWLQKQVLGIAE